MQHVMVDLETIGNDYDGIFTTVGAVTFDPNTGELGGVFYAHVNWESAVAAGRTITPGTIKWWMSQCKEARDEITKEGQPLEFVLQSFADYLPKDPIMWGNGPTFDLGKLENAFGYYDIPWKYYNTRCVRTIRDLSYKLVSKKDIPFEGVPHNALDDAKHQARYVSAMWRALKGGAL